MTDEQHLGAVFEDRESAEAAVGELRRLDLADEHLGVAVHEPEPHVLEEDVESDLAHGIERGVAVGAPIGALAGITLLAAAGPGVVGLGIGGILAAGGVTGALAGGFWGAYLGLTAEEPELEEEWEWERVPLEPGEVLVVVGEHGHRSDVADVLRRHGGHLVAKPAHID